MNIKLFPAVSWRFVPILILFCLVSYSGWLFAKQQGRNHQQILREGSVQERITTLNWLKVNGDTSLVAEIISSLKDKNMEVRELAENTLWAIWSRSGNTDIDDMLKQGTYNMLHGNPVGAMYVFTKIINLEPEFAEGYNKRATASYLLGDFEGALNDIKKVIQLNPLHFGALSGAGFTLVRMERMGEALIYFNRALTINPNMNDVVDLRKDLIKMMKKKLI